MIIPTRNELYIIDIRTVQLQFFSLCQQVQQEIERLRISQAEKQLELKEAATRRRLWELKQQLLQSSTSQTTSPPPTSTATVPRISNSQPTAQPTANAPLPQSHTPVQSCSQSTRSSLPLSQSSIESYGKCMSNKQRDASKPPYTAPQQLKHMPECTNHMPSKGGEWSSLSADGKYPSRVSKCTDEENPADLSSQIKDTKTYPFRQPTHTQDATHGVTENIVKHAKTQLSPSRSRTFEAQPPLFHSVTHAETRTASHREDTSQEGHTHSHAIKHTSIPTNSPAPQHSPQKDTISTQQKVISQADLQSSHQKDNPLPPSEARKSQLQKRQRLTLPDEIKETEYMSAVQRQRARVSRIRRCIAAATVIQRAWREHRERVDH